MSIRLTEALLAAVRHEWAKVEGGEIALKGEPLEGYVRSVSVYISRISH